VTAKLSEEGSFASPGAPLLQITDISILKFTINVPEGDLNQFSLNQLYKIVVDAYPEMALQGKAYLIGSKGNISNSFLFNFWLRIQQI
jgi:multidrug resistance efflux pump